MLLSLIFTERPYIKEIIKNNFNKIIYPFDYFDNIKKYK